ncbi:unnamed protein product [Plutella xylostella]|uniref:(diamondback moth) hypothetical protein n=1 Tax=Plutella xylostella TaxID=51655 RepID=A0A8S4G7I5_PLUXY|nr:unnamed protein product [Plutella xylostella]
MNNPIHTCHILPLLSTTCVIRPHRNHIATTSQPHRNGNPATRRRHRGNLFSLLTGYDHVVTTSQRQLQHNHIDILSLPQRNCKKPLGNTYNLISHNCNNFSEEIAQFLCGAHIPAEILELPERALPPALRAALPALLDRLLPAQPNTEPNAARSSREDSPDYELLNDQIEEARACGQQLKAKRRTLAEKLARRQRRRDKKNPHLEVIMAEAEASAGPSAAKDVEPEERRPAFPPIVYKDIDALAEYDKLMSTLSGTTLSGEETEALEELRLYLQGEGSWVLGDHFLTTIGRVVDLGGDARTTALRVLSGAALRDDVSLLLHQDRRGHVLADLAYSLDRLPVEDQQAIATFKHYSTERGVLWTAALRDDVSLLLHQDRRGHVLADLAYSLDRLPVEDQQAIATFDCSTERAVLWTAALRDDVSLLLQQARRGPVLADLAHSLDTLPAPHQHAVATFMCNLFENVSSSEWLLYISEWESRHGPLSNIRVTTKVAVHALLSEDEQLKDVGTALMYNIALKEVKTVMFDDVAVELAMALVQFVGSAPREEHLYRAWRALAALAARSRTCRACWPSCSSRPTPSEGQVRAWTSKSTYS